METYVYGGDSFDHDYEEAAERNEKSEGESSCSSFIAGVAVGAAAFAAGIAVGSSIAGDTIIITED